MSIRIGRTLPPAAAPIPLRDILRALPSCLSEDADDLRFEGEVQQEFGVKYCMLASSGKAALVLLLKALQKIYPDRDEVLVSAFTCYSVPAAIKKAGFKIRLCDTGKRTFDFDKTQLEDIIETDKKNNKIICVLVTHLFGCPADFHGMKKIIGDKIPIVEDAAQAMGEEMGEKKLGTLGDVGFFSLGRGKALSAMGGGVIVTDRDDVAGALNEVLKHVEASSFLNKLNVAVKTLLTTVLQHPVVFWLPKSLPFLKLGETLYEEDFSIQKMSSFQRNLVRNWQKRIKKHQTVRRKNIHFWQENVPQIMMLSWAEQRKTSLIRLPFFAQSAEERDRICLKSEATGCGVMPTYPTPINEISHISDEFSGQYFPMSALIFRDVMSSTSATVKASLFPSSSRGIRISRI
ncbi:MAG: DegT/DnrJ/EryC1/StrS aminotransferase family protein [Candidatus Electrothrix sp. ATG2]|nr:DegT/DnrJ/EryC1/StrS aminotransferase family protein [Candidatus Electrothrix sp. ATG2]